MLEASHRFTTETTESKEFFSLISPAWRPPFMPLARQYETAGQAVGLVISVVINPQE